MTDLLLWNSIKLCSSLFQMQILRCLRLVILCWVCQMSDKINCLLVLLLGRVIAILDRYVIENVLIFEAHGVKPLKMQAACFFNVYLILTICINVYMQWSIGLDIRCIETFPCKRCGREEDINCWFVEMRVVSCISRVTSTKVSSHTRMCLIICSLFLYIHRCIC